MTKTPPKTIATIKAALKKGASVTQVVQEHLTAIEKKNPNLNAFLTITTDSALKEAADADLLLSKDSSLSDKPLFGVPIAYKDIFMTKGVRTTASSKVLGNYIAQYSATVVDKLKQAGAIMLGKLNCDAWAHGSSGENSDFGPTKNPINPDYVPGGSSSGSAAAVAADLVPLTMGSDTGGSIRLPANFCGVVGFKPTYGRVSRYGVISMASSLDSIGHFTHTIEDAATVLEITSGPDIHDANTANSKGFSTKNLKTGSLKGLKVGIPKQYLEPIKNKEVKNNFDLTVKKLEQAGAIVEPVSLPHTEYAAAVYYIIQPSEVSSNLARFDGIRFGHDRDAFGAEAMRRILIGTHTLSSGYYDAYYKTATKVRTLINDDFNQAFAQFDVLIAPVSPTPAFKLGEKATDPLQMYLSDILTIPVNLAGLPAIAQPTGFTENGLPLGIQTFSKRYSEEQLFPICYQIEQLLQ